MNNLTNRLIYKYFQFRINTILDPYQIQLRNTPYKILLVLSHMRSGSSLLTHILNSNPEIIGYGETHLNYYSEKDFKKLMFKVYWRLKDLKMNHQYLMDKILHDKKISDKNLLLSEKIQTIFLLRHPHNTLPSILNLKTDWTEEKALAYYCQRLSTLEKYAKIINSQERSLLITYDQLVKKSNLVFETLQQQLNTKIGFSEEYQILKTTGVRGIGDSSENIKAGRIVQQTKNNKIEISSEVEAKARQAFESCYETLSQYCQVIKYNS